jgi:hypothetical protein
VGGFEAPRGRSPLLSRRVWALKQVGGRTNGEDYRDLDIGLSYQVTVVLAGLLLPGDRGVSYQVTVDNF